MKCPKCGKDLIIRDEKVATSPEGAPVYNEYAVCMDCHKKWNLDRIRAKQSSTPVEESAPEDNLPPEPLRQQRETEMKKNYTAMLNSGRDEASELYVDDNSDDEDDDIFVDEFDEDEDDEDDDDDDKPSKVPVVILTIIIILALLCAGTLFYCKKTNHPIPFIGTVASEQSVSELPSDAQALICEEV